MSAEATETRIRELAARVQSLREAVGARILGQRTLIEDTLVAVLAGGHVLLEGLPGLGKTSLVHAISAGLGLDTQRIQFTPDLMPADITGTRIVEEHGGRMEFRFQQGPLFAHLVLADEINRGTPKTQSALLEAMQEGSVTVGQESHRLPKPFAVVATQNPIELEGTFPLPEAQLDRFLYHLVVEKPPVDDLVAILASTTGRTEEPVQPVLDAATVSEIQSLAREILCADHLLRYVAELVHATDPDAERASPETRRLVRYGASPRAAQSIVLTAKVRALLDARPSVDRSDLDRSLLPALRHRVVLTFEADAENLHVADLLPAWKAGASGRAHV